MKNVVIIDDEYIVLQGMSQLIHWEDYGMRIAGIAYDGNSGLSVIRDVCPDLVFTDIRMPGMNGLDLISRARQYAPKAAFIIISGFNDFEYVRSALRLNVFDYLEKPITTEKMNEVLERYQSLDRHVPGEMSYTQDQDGFERCMQACIQLCIQQDSVSEQKIRAIWNQSGLHMPEIDVLLCMRTECCNSETFQHMERELNRELKNEKMHLCSVADSKGGSIVLYGISGMSDVGGLKNQIQRVCERLTGQGEELYTGISHIHAGIEALTESMEEARVAMSYAVFLDEACICVENVMPMNSLPAAYGKSEQNIAFSMRVGDRHAVRESIEELLKSLMSFGVSMELFCHEMLELIYLGLHVLREAGVEYEFDSDLPHVEIQHYRSVHELRKWVLARFEDFMDCLEEQSQNKGRKSVQKAREYIDQHYGEYITLEQLAEICDMNPTYFSMLFKLQVGQTYVKYINNVRMEQAKSMLMKGISIRRISENVGFTSQRYFSDRFKVYWGCTPTQLREKMQEEKQP